MPLPEGLPKPICKLHHRKREREREKESFFGIDFAKVAMSSEGCCQNIHYVILNE